MLQDRLKIKCKQVREGSIDIDLPIYVAEYMSVKAMTRMEVEDGCAMVTREHIDLCEDRDYTEVRNFRNTLILLEEEVENYLRD